MFSSHLFWRKCTRVHPQCFGRVVYDVVINFYLENINDIIRKNEQNRPFEIIDIPFELLELLSLEGVGRSALP